MLFWRLVEILENWAASVAVTVFTISTVIGVFFRYILNAPLSWTAEASLIAFAWLLFLGAAICTRERKHISIDVISWAIGGRLEWLLAILAELAALAVTLVLVPVSWSYASGSAAMLTSVFQVSTAIFTMSAPVGFALIGLHFVQRILTDVDGLLSAKAHASVVAPVNSDGLR